MCSGGIVSVWWYGIVSVWWWNSECVCGGIVSVCDGGIASVWWCGIVSVCVVEE